MKEALERIDSAAMFIVAGERERGREQADAEPRPLRATSWTSSRATSPSGASRRRPPCSAAPGPTTARPTPASPRGRDHAALEADYFKTMNPLFVATKDAADRILDLNQDAMVRKRDQAAPRAPSARTPS